MSELRAVTLHLTSSLRFHKRRVIRCAFKHKRFTPQNKRFLGFGEGGWLCFPFLLVVCRTKGRERLGSGTDLKRNHSPWWEVTLRTETLMRPRNLCPPASFLFPQLPRHPVSQRNVRRKIKVSRGGDKEASRPSALEPNPRLCDQKTNKQPFPLGLSNLLSGTNVSFL